MPNNLRIATNLNPSLIALKPRQVLLANANANAIATMSEDKSCSSLKPEQRTLLLSSLAQYLERSGFSKTGKKFRSEAQIQKDDIKDSTPDLEEIFNNYLETCNHDTNANSQKEQDAQKDDIPKTEESDTVVAVEALSKKKKKKSIDNDGYASLVESKTADTKKPEVMIMSSTASQLNGKIKEKKKSKKNCGSLDQGTEHVSSEANEEHAQKNVGESHVEEPNKGDKEKRKKKSKLLPESLCGDGENYLESESKDVTSSEKENKSKTKKKKKNKISSENEKDNIKSSVIDVVTVDTRASKKRKGLASEENDYKLVDENSIEESELRKTGIDTNNVKESAGENGLASSNEAEKTPMKQLKGCDNGNPERSVEKSSKKQRIGSTEPTSLKAFQRVKVDEVVFTDDRLQDNSYWAKDGAETGYGAKAQEVLGQVRGRDFRHEKTKKKRGSYRGGQIDLQSHSVKFNYSDEE